MQDKAPVLDFSLLWNIEDFDIAGTSSDEIDELIRQLAGAKQLALQREEEERRRQEIEKKERVEREKLERERRESHIQEVTSMELPMDWENVFNLDPRAQGVHADSIQDALILSQTTLGRVDIEFMASITGEDYRTVIETLKGSIYQNPDTWDECFYKGWEPAQEYLSGNLMRKWKSAKEADKKYHGYFADNVRAIEQVLPPAVPAEDIYITLGSPWVPTDIIDDFIVHMYGYCRDPEYYQGGTPDWMRTKHDEFSGSWEIPEKRRYEYYCDFRSKSRGRKWRKETTLTLQILEKTLNMKSVAVMKEVRCDTNESGKRKVIDKPETAAAIEIQKTLMREFQDWVWTDPERKERLAGIYEERFGCVRRRIFDGSFLTFPGMSSSVELYPYQKDAVARIIFSANTLLAHDVGAGKTYEMVAAGQELKRMGLSSKNLYVVPNNIVGQWEKIFLKMYPDAKVLCVEPKVFSKKKRQSVLKKIRDEEYDGIIMAYSCFSLIPLSMEYRRRELERKKERLEKAASENRGSSGIVNGLNRKLRKVRKELAEIQEAEEEKALWEITKTGNEEKPIFFDDLGITRLFVDEAHNFKNVPFDTKADRILGINSNGNAKCSDMLEKVRMIQRNNDGKGVVFATGTPITNSVTDAFVMQLYLQSGELAMMDLQNFDSWIGMFAERVTEFEIDVDTSSYRLATRFARFHNLPELTVLLSSIADFHQVDVSSGIPQFDGYQDALVVKTPEFESYLKDISQRADDVRSGRVDRTVDNMLLITTDGRKAALDMRLVDPSASFTYDSKAARCVENVADLYYKTARESSVQIIFCDTSTPKADFNLYTELKQRLMLSGIPEKEIAFIHDAQTEAVRTQLFAKVNKGIIRVLIGSTFKLGIGVNVQERLCAIHHLDVPWRPADMTQREGRILRQGNTNEKVLIYRYITEGSFDAYSWQLLETKQRFISDLLSGSMEERSGSDIEKVVLNYAEVKALAVGNPLVKERVEAANELSRCRMLQKKLVETRLRCEKELLELPGRIRSQKDLIEKCSKDLAWYEEWKRQNLPPAENVVERKPKDAAKSAPKDVSKNAAKKAEAQERKRLRELIGAALRKNVLMKEERTLITYRGFRIVLPANMVREKPSVWLERSGRYSVSLGDTDAGNLIRIDHFLDQLDSRLDQLRQNLDLLEEKRADLQKTLAKDESYADRIEECRRKIEDIDHRLGVTNNDE